MKVVVVGTSGSGKSTLADRLASVLGVAHVELDALWHRPNWTTVSPEELRAQVERALDEPGWVVDGNYSMVRDIVWAPADVILWLDYPRWFVMQRMVRRSVRRALLRTELWHGNREDVRRLVKRDPEDNIVLWAWTTHAKNRATYEEAFSDQRWADKRKVRLRSTRETRSLLATVAAASVTDL